MFKSALEVLELLSNYGEAYIVGGVVRDYYLSKNVTGDKFEPHDIDITTNVPMNIIECLFETYDIGKNKDFGIVCIKHNGFNFEIAQMRKDGQYSDGRRPDSVEFTSSLEEDLSRRDFTINAMALGKDLQLIDPYGGRFDLGFRVLTSVGIDEDRISEDYLRIMRAVRFSSRFGLEMNDSLKYAIYNNVVNLNKIAPERIWDEIMKMTLLGGDKFANCIMAMFELRILDQILPEISRMYKFPHSKKHHPEGGVFLHVISALRNTHGDPMNLINVLFHDVGKPKTYKWNAEKQSHSYHGHEDEGVKIIDHIAARFKWSNNLKGYVEFCCKNHMLFHILKKMRDFKKIKLLKHPCFSMLRIVGQADTLSRNDDVGQNEWKEVEAEIERVSKLEGFKKYDELKNKISGEYIMQIRNWNPSKKVGFAKDVVFEKLLNNPRMTDVQIENLIKGISIPNEFN